MQIKTLGHVNGRTADGRVYSAGEGAVTVIDDNDKDMVALMRGWAASGDVLLLEDEGERTAEPGESLPPIPESAYPEGAQPLAETDDLDQLRTEAVSAGVKVDKRWGADRLREEIAAAAAVNSSEGDQ